MPSPIVRNHPNNYQWSDVLDTKLRELWTSLSLLELAREFHCSHHTIGRRGLHLALPKRPKAHEDWPREKEDQLRQMWEEGISCGAIGAALGCTRNAVIGKRMRMKLPERMPSPIRASGVRAPRRRKYYHVPTTVKPTLHTPLDMATLDAANPGVTLMALRADRCHDVLRTLRDGARYCGEPVVAPGKSFCAGHHAIYYTPAPVRVRRAPPMRA